jgi:hypothetical protein
MVVGIKGGNILEPFQEAQKHAAVLVMKHGNRSVFGLIGQLLEDIQEQDWSENFKWEIWKDTCRKIKKLNPNINAKIEGCQTSDAQNFLKLVFDDLERINVTCFEEVIRYTEYCRRLALQNEQRAKDVTVKSDNVNKNETRDFNVSERYQRSLLYYQLTDSRLSMVEKIKIAEQARDILIVRKLWEKIDSKDKTLKNLREAIKNLLNSSQL